MLYSSANVITKENLFDIWHAANQLQIPFLITECERFAVTIISLENYDEVLEHAFLLESKDSAIESDMGKNVETISFDKNELCDDFSNKEGTLEAEENRREVQEDDFKEMIEQSNPEDKIIMNSAYENSTRDISLNVEINSTELKTDFQKAVCDDGSGEVIAPAQCVNVSQIDSKDNLLADDNKTKHDEVNTMHDKQEMTVQLNPRAKYVADILAAARLSLPSEDMLARLFRHKLVDNKAARDILFNSSLYRNRSSISTEWPPSTIPRKEFTNEIIVFLPMIDLSITAYSFQRLKFVSFPKCEEIKFCLNLSIAMGQIYATGYTSYYDDSLAVFLLSRRKWLQITDYLNIENSNSRESIMYLIPQNNFVYLIIPANRKLMRLDLLSTNDFEMMSKVPNRPNYPIQYVTSYKHKIIVFCSVTSNSSNKTMALSYDTISNKWTTSCSFEGLAQNMTSFERNNETYLLMSD
ncbi:hypothetical protein Btru_032840 [Bulinus truncatus]|nr:hypothetical protein Btru_032840 [Bulinus truncatus]